MRKLWVALLLAAAAVGAKAAEQPDNQIAYLRFADNYWQVWVTDAEGNQHRQITYDPTDKARVSWSPDRKRLLCNSNDGTLQIIDLKTLGAEKILLDSIGAFDAQWSPSGKQITYSATTSLQADNAEIWVADLSGSSKRKITDSLAVALTPAWNPKKGSILYSTGKPGKNQELWEANPITGQNEQLTISKSSALDPSINSQGGIVYSSDVAGSFNLWLVDAEQKPRQLTSTSAFDAQPSWSPDAAKIVFYRLEKNSRRLWVIDLKTRQSRPITPAAVAARYPAWIR